MTAMRFLRWIILLAAFAASVTWSYIAIDHLLGSSMNPQQRVSGYNSTAKPPPTFLKEMERSQMKWGRQSLFAVACSFFFLLAVLMNWVLDGRHPRLQQR